MHFLHLPPLPWSKSMETRWGHWPQSQPPCGEKNWNRRPSLFDRWCSDNSSVKKLGRNHMKSLPSPQRSPLDPSWYGPSSPCSPFRWAWWHIKSEVGSPIIETTLKLVFLHSFPANSAWSMLWSVGPWQLQLAGWKLKLQIRVIGWIWMDLTLWNQNDASHLSRNCNLEGNHPAPTHDHRVFHVFFLPHNNRLIIVRNPLLGNTSLLLAPWISQLNSGGDVSKLRKSCTLFHRTTNGPAKCQGLPKTKCQGTDSWRMWADCQSVSCVFESYCVWYITALHWPLAVHAFLC